MASDEEFLEEQLLNNALLFIAIRKNNLLEKKMKQITKYLDRGANINAVDANNKNNTPLHVAVLKGEIEVTELLLVKGADVTQKNSNSLTALDIARASKKLKGREITKLIEKYFDKNSIKKCQVTNQGSLMDPITEQKPAKQQLKRTQYYQKRSGTSGFSGHLYETKLLSLILLRALHCKNMKNFFLATNVAGMGAFDDVVFRYELDYVQKPKIIFLQAKHRDDPSKDKLTVEEVLKASGDFSLHKYLESYLQIVNKFSLDSNDVIFKGSVKSVECDFIIFTSTFENFCKKKVIGQAYIDMFLNIDDNNIGKVFQFNYDDNDLELLISTVVRSRTVLLAKTLSKFILKDNNNYNNMMMNDLIKSYHVFLAQNVIMLEREDYDIKAKDSYCVGKFRKEFLTSTDEYLLLMKYTIYNNIIGVKKTTSMHQEHSLQETMALLSFKLPAYFGNTSFCFKGSLTKRQRRLNYLITKFKKLLPKENNIYSKYIYVSVDNSMVGPMEVLQETDVEYYRLGGLVGNLLTFDDETKMLKFNLNEENLSEDNLKLLEILRQEFQCLTLFRLHINVRHFPRLSLYDHEHDKQTVKEFLNNLKFYTNQAKESYVEYVVKKEIEALGIAKQRDFFFQIKRDAIFLKLHDDIQKWWQQPARVSYLTESCQLYHKAQQDILQSPVLSILNFIFRESIKKITVEFKPDIVASLKVIEFLHNEKRLMMVMSDQISFTSLKLINHFNNTNITGIISFIYVDLSFVNIYFETVKLEFRNANIQVLVLVCQEMVDTIQIRETVNTIARDYHGKIIIVSSKLAVIEYFENDFRDEHITVIDNENKFHDITDKGQQMILEERNIMFQGEDVTVGSVLDSEMLRFIDTDMLYKLIIKERNKIGKILTSPSYEDIAEFYLNRSICRYLYIEQGATINIGISDKLLITTTELEQHFKETCEEYNDLNVHWFIASDDRLIWKRSRGTLQYIMMNIFRGSHDDFTFQVETLDDVQDKLVIISAEPGMGKSTLLTHLAIQTKRMHPNLWISKINLIEHVIFYSNWKENLTEINIVEAVKFLYYSIGLLGSNTKHAFKILSAIESSISIDNMGNINFNNTEEETLGDVNLFELNIFNQLYNNDHVVLLFDGFDEICPDYATEIVQLLNVFKDSKVRTLWVSTRSQNAFNQLEVPLGTFSYNLQPLTATQQRHFLQKIWSSKLSLGNAFSPEMQFCVETFFLLVTILIRERSFTSIPLHLYMISDFFEDYFRDYYDPFFKNISDSNIRDAFRHYNLFGLYEMFVEIKFFRIRFGEKKPIMCYKDPDIRKLVEKEYEAFLEGHKKVGAYLVLDNSIVKDLFTDQDMADMNKLIEDVKSGQDKTGIIECIIDNAPKFVHFSFAEYFAARFLFDKLCAGLLTGSFQRHVFDETIQNNNGGIRRFITSRIIKDVQQSFDGHIDTLKPLHLEPLVVGLDEYVSPPENTCTKTATKISQDRTPNTDPSRIYIGRISYITYIRFSNHKEKIDVVWGRRGNTAPWRNVIRGKPFISEHWDPSHFTMLATTADFELEMTLFSLMHAITTSRKDNLVKHLDLSVCELVVSVNIEQYDDEENSTTWSSILRLRV